MMRRGRKRYSEKGVTIIELAVVLAIIAIMALFMTPSIGEWVQNYRIKQSARNLASDLQAARMQAINSHTYCTVAFNITVGGTLYSYVIFPDYNCDMVLQTAPYTYNGVTVNEATAIYKQVVFSTEYKTVTFDTSTSTTPPTTGTDGIRDGITFTGNTFAFDSRGLPRDNAGNFTGGIVYLRNTANNKCRSITVSNGGAISIAEY
jgi:prepilin-type N-terminal cleavage/methylation domain-containing protein